MFQGKSEQTVASGQWAHAVSGGVAISNQAVAQPPPVTISSELQEACAGLWDLRNSLSSLADAVAGSEPKTAQADMARGDALSVMELARHCRSLTSQVFAEFERIRRVI